MQNINEIDELIKLISKLPGLGPKSAKRIVLKLINNRDELVKPMANILVIWLMEYLMNSSKMESHLGI